MTEDIALKAIAGVIRREGGYVDDPDDLGGPTKFGITLDDWKQYFGVDGSAKDIENLDTTMATAMYLKLVWTPMNLDGLPPELATVLFDQGVLRGSTTAIRTLQGVLHIMPDGHLGPATEALIRTSGDPRLIALKFLRACAQKDVILSDESCAGEIPGRLDEPNFRSD